MEGGAQSHRGKGTSGFFEYLNLPLKTAQPAFTVVTGLTLPQFITPSGSHLETACTVCLWWLFVQRL